MELKLDNISKKYGAFRALKNISFTFSPGIYGLLGPNGAGKSTLMNIIAGILNPTSGTVLLDGVKTVKLGKEYRRKLGFLPQKPGFYKDFTAFEFLQYVACLKGMKDKSRIRTEILRLLENLNLKESAGKKLKEFSGGMLERVGIAQALLSDPDILIFDEPTAGLDPKERVRFRNLISDLSFDKIIILSTHIVSDIELIADNLLMIYKGSAVLSGTIDECVKCMRGKIYTTDLPRDRTAEFALEHRVISMGRISDAAGACRVRVRYIDGGENVPQATAVEPSLEDVYMYYLT